METSDSVAKTEIFFASGRWGPVRVGNPGDAFVAPAVYAAGSFSSTGPAARKNLGSRISISSGLLSAFASLVLSARTKLALPGQPKPLIANPIDFPSLDINGPSGLAAEEIREFAKVVAIVDGKVGEFARLK
jgi:hypothetical protein